MDVPKKLYRYQSASFDKITSLSDGTIWFSRPATFNDPFDCAFDVALSQISDDALQQVINSLPFTRARKPRSVNSAEQKKKHALLTGCGVRCRLG